MAAPARVRIDTSYFFHQIAHAAHKFLVIDFDTTLPSFSLPLTSKLRLPTVRELLDNIILSGRTRVVFSSRRAAKEVAAFLSPPFPEVWGRSGAERISVAAPGSATGVFSIHPGQQPVTLQKLFRNLCTRGPLAYIVGELIPDARAPRFFVRPQFYLSRPEAIPGASEDLIQFLADWLWASAGETC